jgi:transcriptional regulator with XRE-family HTH domain
VDQDRSSAPLDVIAAALRRERDRVGLSLSELAKRAGIAKSTLSQLESGAGNPSVETLWALGVALGVPFSRLVDPPRPPVRVVRFGEGAYLRSEQSNYSAALLSACPPGARRDIYLATMSTDAGRHSVPHMSGTVEHLVVSAGRVLAGPADDPVELGPGDYLSYPGDIPHIYQALVPDSVTVMVMEHV